MSKTQANRPQNKQPQHTLTDPKAADTRLAILDAAADLFRRQGYAGFSLRQVAKTIGYTPTTIYLYFKDKDDLLFHVALEGFKHFGGALRAAYASGSTPLERLEAIGRAYVRFGLDHPLHYQLMFIERGEFLRQKPPEGFEAPIDAFAILVQTITECMEAGYVRDGDPMTYATTVWATVHGIVALAITECHVERAQIPIIEEVAFSMITKGLRP